MLKAITLMLLSTATIAAQSIGPTVNENAIRIIDGRSIEFSIDNPGPSFSANVTVDVLAPDDNVVSTSSARVDVAAGAGKILLPFETGWMNQNLSGSKFWYRVRYSIVPITGAPPINGLVSISKIDPDAFDLKVISRSTFDDARFRVLVVATQVATFEPVANVSVTGTVRLSDDTPIEAKAVTGPDGTAALEFTIPKLAEFRSGDLVVEGKIGSIVRTVADRIYFEERPLRGVVTTDKPLYQPSQTVRFRTYVFDPDGKPAANGNFKFAIFGGRDYKNVYEGRITTSRFGIAHSTWRIPGGTGLGDFRIEIEDDDDDSVAAGEFRVTRYQVPTFSVNVSSDRKYYLRDNPVARIALDAAYIFGKPVQAGTVKVIGPREDSVEFGEISGSLDANGKFSASINLAPAFALFDEDTERQYRDLRFKAVVSDALTNRSETRTITLRISEQPINIYLTGADRSFNGNFPVEFLVGAFYPDGSPAECDIAVYQRYDTADGVKLEKSEIGEKLATARTNRYGVARVDFKPEPETNGELKLKVAAADINGVNSDTDADVRISDRDTVRIRPEKILNRPGDPIRLTLSSNRHLARVIVDVTKNRQTIYSITVQLESGEAEILIPNDPRFKGLVEVSATIDNPNERASASSILYFWGKREFDLDAVTDRQEYRPGEDARLEIRTRGSGNDPREAALGVLVIDRAIEELAKSEGERDDRFSWAAALRFPFAYAAQFDWQVIAPDVTVANLRNLDPSKPIDPQLQLAVEYSTRQDNWSRPNISRSEKYSVEVDKAFSDSFRALMAGTAKVIDEIGAQPPNDSYPVSTDELRREVSARGGDVDALRDPWGNPLQTDLKKDRDIIFVEIWSLGPDETAGTSDDLSLLTERWNHFSPISVKIGLAFRNFAERTRRTILDFETLQKEALELGTDLEKARDLWGNPYRFEFTVDRMNYVLNVRSAGPDGKFGGSSDQQTDDVTVWTSRSDYFSTTKRTIASILSEQIAKSGQFPVNETRFREMLAAGGFDLSRSKDAFGRPFYVSVKETWGSANGYRLEGKKSLVIRQKLVTFMIRSAGRDGIVNNLDDFEMTRFSGVASVDSSDRPVPGSPPLQLLRKMIPTNGNGAAFGRIVDQNGASIPGSEVVITNESTKATRSTFTNDEGTFYFPDIAPGIYEISAVARHFRMTIVQNVAITAGTLTELTITLEIGDVTTVVEVSAPAGVETMTSNASVNSSVTQSTLVRINDARKRNFTPRVRDDFEEILVWQPELVTAKDGSARIDFKMADNITNWSVYVVGNDENGNFALKSMELRSFKPLFADLDPPRILTEGDEITIPATIRNYGEKKRDVDVALAPNDWSTLLTPGRQKLEIGPNTSSNAVFRIRADRPSAEAKQRVTAKTSKDSDTIEKPVTVRPNSFESPESTSEFVTGTQTLEFSYSPDALPGSRSAKLKIYPNVVANIVESTKALLVKPHGCGEQTTSSTYPNLMLLEIENDFGGKLDDNTRLTAEANLREGYERILTYQETGGFGYFDPKSPDAALTGYVLRFMHDSSRFIDVDENRAERAEDWLFSQQKTDGSWSSRVALDQLTTAYILRSIVAAGELNDRRKIIVRKGLDYLKANLADRNDVYLIASMNIAARALGDEETVDSTLARIRELASPDRDGSIWNGSKTPFGGSGLPANIEATALAVNALLASKEVTDVKLARSGILSLMRSKDPAGIWYSTQTTVVVLETLGKFRNVASPGADGKIRVDIVVNGVSLPPATLDEATISQPAIIDLTKYLADSNRVEVRMNGAAALVSLAKTSYFRWEKIPRQSGNIDFSVEFDKTQAKPAEPITAKVRVGSRTFGSRMTTAEIGLPPGTEVDRVALDNAVKSERIERYDVLPDRVVVYFWKSTEFEFRFAPRFAMKAVSAPSVAYDYYNDEERRFVAPVKFSVE